MFSIKTNQVQLEAGDDIMSPSSPRDGKLFRFADWLYGNRDQQFEFDKITIRMAPSIITRSEIELLGLSSPRFAFRANFGSHGFVTIRRRIIIEARIRIAHRSANYLGNLFPKEKDPDSPWIADCLLRIPDRFRDFHVISCDLRSDYGEDLLDSDSQGLVPFVTHVLFGGGLCAQAACFMALCLVQSEQILGISEITSEALADADRSFPIRGLDPKQIEKFFDSDSRQGISSQLQHKHLADPGSDKRICKALRAYVTNNIPVLQIVSLERMLGHGVDDSDRPLPVVHLTNSQVNHDDYRHIPIGYTRTPKDFRDCYVGHCVLVVGCSETSFILNDPASFPFLECTDTQITEISPYTVDENAEANLPVEARYNLDPLILDEVPRPEVKPPTQKPEWYLAISVTPQAVKIPLLEPGLPPTDDQEIGSGLFLEIDAELVGGYRFGLTSNEDSPCLYGEYYLVTVYKDQERNAEWRKPCWNKDDGVQLDILLRDPVMPALYWLHHTYVVDSSDCRIESIWLWEASQRFAKAKHCLKHVFVKNTGKWQFTQAKESQ